MPHLINFWINWTHQKFFENIGNIGKWLQICYQDIKPNGEFDAMYSIKTSFEETRIKEK